MRQGSRRGGTKLRILVVVGIGAVGAAARFLAAQSLPPSASPPAKAPPRPVAVHVAVARKADLKVYFSEPATVVAFNTVTVRSRVDGEIVNVAFTEGQMVKEGELLLEIDPRPFQIQLAQAEGQLEKNKAALADFEVNLKRLESAGSDPKLGDGAVSLQQLDTMRASVNQLKGTLKADQAAIDAALLQLRYCRITAPFSGLIGLRSVDKGNFVHASDTSTQGLATITQLQPIAVVFSVPQDDFASIATRVAAHAKLPVEVYDRELKNKLAEGQFLAHDSQIDAGTSTIRFKAVFENSESALFPNQFVNARLLYETRKDQVLVPTVAVQRSARSRFVYVAKSDDTVELREVEPGPTEGEETAIEKGLAAGEVVVMDGIDKLKPGAKIAVPNSKSGDKGEKRSKP